MRRSSFPGTRPENLTGEYLSVPPDDTPPADPLDTFRLHWKTSQWLVGATGAQAVGPPADASGGGQGHGGHHRKRSG